MDVNFDAQLNKTEMIQALTFNIELDYKNTL